MSYAIPLFSRFGRRLTNMSFVRVKEENLLDFLDNEDLMPEVYTEPASHSFNKLPAIGAEVCIDGRTFIYRDRMLIEA